MRVEEVVIQGAGASAVVVEKRLSTRERGVPEAALRLRGEATLLATLGGIVTPRLVAAGEDDRGPWFHAEKIPFPTLAARLDAAAGRPLDGDWLERTARAAFAALAELHEASDDEGPLGIVHADVSPANVAASDDGSRVVFLDLELATWRGAPARDGAFRGTVLYCAPEIARGEDPRPASDLFSLAACLLHAAVGAPPRDGPSLAALLAVAAETPLLDTRHAALASRGAGHAAMIACLAHEIDARPRSAREVAARLR
jgi:serine/threonine protein kinase